MYINSNFCIFCWFIYYEVSITTKVAPKQQFQRIRLSVLNCTAAEFDYNQLMISDKNQSQRDYSQTEPTKVKRNKMAKWLEKYLAESEPKQVFKFFCCDVILKKSSAC